MTFSRNILIFLIINFAALALGVWLMNNGPQTTWYMDLNKAPWTPPNWLFGIAWSFIMICFSVYMALLIKRGQHKQLIGLFALQWGLNVFWNLLFFNQQLPVAGLLNIAALCLLILYFLVKYRRTLGWQSLWIAPYSIWIVLATSLNLYIVLYN